jgi:photosystem II stability/assembly factor-like uncharacterized protein
MALVLFTTACTKKIESDEIVKIPNPAPSYSLLYATGYNYSNSYVIDANNLLLLTPASPTAGGVAVLKATNGGNFETIYVGPAYDTSGPLTMANNKVGYYAGPDHILLKTIDGGFNWNETYTASWYILDMAAPDANTVFVEANSTIYKSADAGSNWTVSIPQNFDNSPGKIYFYNSNIGFVALRNGGFMKTINAGKDWTKLSLPTNQPVVNFFFLDQNKGFAIAQGERKLYTTTNGGQTWSSIPQDDFLAGNGTMVFYPDGRGIITADGGHVYYTRDFGKTTKLFLNAVGESYLKVNLKIVDDKSIILTYDKGIYKINFGK